MRLLLLLFATIASFQLTICQQKKTLLCPTIKALEIAKPPGQGFETVEADDSAMCINSIDGDGSERKPLVTSGNSKSIYIRLPYDYTQSAPDKSAKSSRKKKCGSKPFNKPAAASTCQGLQFCSRDIDCKSKTGYACCQIPGLTSSVCMLGLEWLK